MITITTSKFHVTEAYGLATFNTITENSKYQTLFGPRNKAF